MKLRPLILSLITSSLLSFPAFASAGTLNLGEGYNCDGTNIVKGAKTLSVRVASKSIGKRIANLNSHIKTLKHDGACMCLVRKAMKRIAELRSTRKQVEACASGELAGPNL